MLKTKIMKILYTVKARQTPYYYGRETYYDPTPKISMEGKWLDALGFHIGDAIQVSYEDNCIRITPAPEPAMVCEPETKYNSMPTRKYRKKQSFQ